MEPLLEEVNRTRPLFALTLHLEVSNDTAVFVYHPQMLSDIPLTVPSRGHITIHRCYVKVKQVEGYQDETEQEEELEYQPTARETTKTVS